VRKYSKAELLAFLRKLDQRLEEHATFTVIGGAAAILAYGAKKPTGDIDTWGSVPGSVEKAALEILNQGDEFVPIGSAGVADSPTRPRAASAPPLSVSKSSRSWSRNATTSPYRRPCADTLSERAILNRPKSQQR
jgi:hypothetical protein